MRIAITREVSAAIERCELTHRGREPIDLLAARRQHHAYQRALQDLGCSIVGLAAGDDMPDSVFVEDVALVFPELAVITRPGAEVRRAETSAVAGALAAYRRLAHIDPPGTLDGGDVLTAGKHVYVGESARTNAAAVAQLRRLLAPHGYTVDPVPIGGCLHLKSAVTAIAEDVLLINPDWVPSERFRPFRLVDVDPAEPYGANALLVADGLIYPTAFPRTRARLDACGLRIVGVDVSELAKAEGAVTCCSLIFDV